MSADSVEYFENALLAYVTSARHSKSKNEMINICTVFYDESAIKAAKDILFNIAKVKPIWRRSENKVRENFADILELLNKCDDEQVKIPRFVPADCDSFPPSSGFELIGGYVNKLTDQIIELKRELKDLKDARINSLTMSEDHMYIKEELLEIKGLLKQCKQKEMFESIKRDSFLVQNLDKLFEDSQMASKELHNKENKSSKDQNKVQEEVEAFLSNVGLPSAPSFSQIGRSHEPESENSDCGEGTSPLKLPSYSSVLCEEKGVDVIDCSSLVQRDNNGKEHTVQAAAVKQSSSMNEHDNVDLSDDIKTSDGLGRNKSNLEDANMKKAAEIESDGFTLVQRRPKSSNRKQDGPSREQRGPRPAAVRGTKVSGNMKLRGTKRVADVYVGNVDLESNSDDVAQYVLDEFNVTVDKCVELKSKYEVIKWKSFKVTVNLGDRNLLLKAENWPESVIVRKFYAPRSNNAD